MSPRIGFTPSSGRRGKKRRDREFPWEREPEWVFRLGPPTVFYCWSCEHEWRGTRQPPDTARCPVCGSVQLGCTPAGPPKGVPPSPSSDVRNPSLSSDHVRKGHPGGPGP